MSFLSDIYSIFVQLCEIVQLVIGFGLFCHSCLSKFLCSIYLGNKLASTCLLVGVFVCCVFVCLFVKFLLHTETHLGPNGTKLK